MLNFTDKSFSVKKSLQYKLSIQVDLDGFSFCVYDSLLNKHVALRRVEANLNVEQERVAEEILRAYKEVDWLNSSYKSCSCLYYSQKNTLIPAFCFSQDKLRLFLDFAHRLDELDEIHYKTINGIDVIAVFAVPNPIASELYLKYRNISFYNQCVPLINNLLKKKEDDALYINATGHIADFAVKQNGVFCYHNSFFINSAHDLAYYVSFVLKQLNINAEKISTTFSGFIDTETRITLDACLPNLRVEKSANIPILVGNIIASHQLLSLHECE